MDLDKTSKWVQIITSILATFILIYGILFEYSNYKDNNRKENSLALVDSYSNSELLKSRMKIEALFSNPYLSDAINKLSPSGYNRLIVDLVKNQNLNEDVLVQAEFFERVAICKTSKLCDEKIINDYLNKSVRIFIVRFFPYVCYLRKTVYKDSEVFKKLETYIYVNSTTKNICELY